MAFVLMADPTSGKVALFSEPTTSGSASDPDSARNAPLKNPSSYLVNLRFHSDLDYLEVAFGPTAVAVSHAAVGAGSGPSELVGLNNVLVYGGVSATHVLLTHSLGYVPDFMVVANGDTVYGGTPVQRLSDGRTRHVSAYATTSQIILAESAVRTASAMPAVDVTYTVIVFKRPPDPSGTVLFEVDQADGEVRMGFGKFNSSRPYLQIVSGGTPYGFSTGRTIDLTNGAPRLVDPDGTVTDVVPAGTAMAFAMGSEPGGSISYGPSMAYDGSFTGDGGVLWKVP